MPSPTVTTAIETMTRNREQFEAFCRSLSDAELATVVPNGHWTVKDFIIHLLTFENLTAGWVDGFLKGDYSTPGVGADGQRFDIDKWNEERVSEWRERSLDDLLAEAAIERKRFIAVLEQLSEEQVQQVMEFAGDNKRDPGKVPFGLFLQGLARHDPVHVADMVKALPDKAADPAIQAWIDDRMVQWYQQAMAGPPKR
jgi:hypothetical protein